MKKSLSEIIMLATIAPRHEPFVAIGDGTVILVRRPTDTEVETIHTLTQSEITVSKVPLPVLKSVHKHNKDSLWGVYQAPEEDRNKAEFLGYYAFLHLNQAGREALERADFDANNPSLDHIVPSGERPAAIYIWGVVARRLTRIATPLIARALGKQTYGGVRLYTTAATKGGLAAARGLGFYGAREAEDGLGHLFRLDQPEGAAPSALAAAAAASASVA